MTIEDVEPAMSETGLQSTTNFLTGTIDHATNPLTGAVEQAKASLTQTGRGAIATITRTTDAATGTIVHTRDRAQAALNQATEAIGQVGQATETAKTSLTQVSHQATSRIQDSTQHAIDHAIDQITSTATTATASLDRSRQFAETLSDRTTTGIQTAIAAAIQQWLGAHPVIGWLLTHPLWTIGLLVLTGFLLWGLLGAVAEVIKQSWVAVLRSPLLLARQIGKLGPSRSRVELPEANQNERLQQILARLEALKQEQDALLTEAQAIMGRDRSTAVARSQTAPKT